MGVETRAYKSISAQGSVALSKSGQFSIKPQAAYGVDYGFHLMFNNTFTVSGVIGYDYLFPSSLDLGFRYKGFGAVSSGFLFSIRVPISKKTMRENFLFFGSSAGLKGSFARYTDLITHYFFYLAVTQEPHIDIVPAPEGNWFIRVGIPLVYNLRKDADLSFSAGLSLHLFHEPGLIKMLKPTRGGSK